MIRYKQLLKLAKQNIKQQDPMQPVYKMPFQRKGHRPRRIKQVQMLQPPVNKKASWMTALYT